MFLVCALLLSIAPALASGLPDLGDTGLLVLPTGLPVILAPLPDPAESLGSVGTVYQENYAYNGAVYHLYLYNRPNPADSFIVSYTKATQDAGYEVTSGTEAATYQALYVTDGDLTAILMYDYQGRMLLMVPVDMDFTLRTSVTPAARLNGKANYIEMDLNGVHYESDTNIEFATRSASSGIKQYYEFSGNGPIVGGKEKIYSFRLSCTRNKCRRYFHDPHN